MPPLFSEQAGGWGYEETFACIERRNLIIISPPPLPTWGNDGARGGIAIGDEQERKVETGVGMHGKGRRRVDHLPR